MKKYMYRILFFIPIVMIINIVLITEFVFDFEVRFFDKIGDYMTKKAELDL